MGVRRITRQVVVGGVKIGGDAPISVQTMTKTKTDDVAGTVAQIRASAEAGVDIVRVTVNDKEAADAMKEIVRQSPVPDRRRHSFQPRVRPQGGRSGCSEGQDQSGEHRFKGPHPSGADARAETRGSRSASV